MMGKGGIAIVPSAGVQYRNRDVDFPFRQDSDFMYLTGFLEPEAVAVLMPGREKGEGALLCRSTKLSDALSDTMLTTEGPTRLDTF